MTPADIVELLRWWEPDTVVRPKTLMRKAAAEIERLRESLSIYVHAHRTDNAVPPHIEAAAVKLLGGGSKAAGVEVEG